jgi:hypothetical protein
MARLTATKSRNEFAEMVAIQLLSSWIDKMDSSGEEHYHETDAYSWDLEIAADYLGSKARS